MLLAQLMAGITLKPGPMDRDNPADLTDQKGQPFLTNFAAPLQIGPALAAP